VDEPWQEFELDALAYLYVGGAGVLIAAACALRAPYVLRRPLPLPRLRPGFWTGREVALALLLFRFIVPLAFAALFCSFSAWLPLGDETSVGRLSIYLNVPIIVVSLVLIFLLLRHHARPAQYGLTRARWPANVILGIGLFIVIAPVTLGVDYLVALVFPPGPHQLQKLVAEDFPEWGWVVLVLMTLACAPFAEEVLFRGLLQGWLRRATLVGHIALMMTVLAIGAMPLASYDLAHAAQGPAQDVLVKLAPPSRFDAAAPLVFTLILLAGYGIWLWALWQRYLRDQRGIWLWRPADSVPALPEREETDEDDDIASEPLPPIALNLPDPAQLPQHHDWAWANARLAIYGSAMLFALGHERWPDPIPLFVLGLGLGWLVYRTQSLVGAFVCHTLFNTVACLVLYWSSAAGG
jgi:membrane protease YdiL (CAAX protease family)